MHTLSKKDTEILRKGLKDLAKQELISPEAQVHFRAADFSRFKDPEYAPRWVNPFAGVAQFIVNRLSKPKEIQVDADFDKFTIGSKKVAEFNGSETLFDKAIQGGNTELVDMMLRNGFDIHKNGIFNQTPVDSAHYVYGSNPANPKMLETLFKHGANPNHVEQKSNRLSGLTDGNTILHDDYRRAGEFYGRSRRRGNYREITDKDVESELQATAAILNAGANVNVKNRRKQKPYKPSGGYTVATHDKILEPKQQLMKRAEELEKVEDLAFNNPTDGNISAVKQQLIDVENQKQPDQDKYLKPYERLVARMDIVREKAVEENNRVRVDNIDDIKAALSLDRDVGRKMNEAKKNLEFTSLMRKGASRRPEYSLNDDTAAIIAENTVIPKDVLADKILNTDKEKGLISSEENHQIRKALATASESKDSKQSWKNRTRPSVKIGSEEPQKRLVEEYRRQDQERYR
jgi:hypothetical protein